MRLDLEKVQMAYLIIEPTFLRSPQYWHETLSEITGTRLIIKNETSNPIRSFKGRGADFLVSQTNSEVPLICASAGNFGQAMAYACRKRNIPLTVFAATNANPLKIERMQQLGAKVVLTGDDFDAAKVQAKKFAEEEGARFIEDSKDIETLAGAGTIGIELLEFPEKIDVLLIALGNGALINGIARVFKEMSPSTRIIAVQAKGAPAMVESWLSHTVIVHDRVNTIADGIAVRIPVPEALEDMREMVDEAILVEEHSIIEAMQLIHLHAGIVCEPSGAVGLAALLENKKRFSGLTIGTIFCGGNLTKEQVKMWL